MGVTSWGASASAQTLLLSCSGIGSRIAAHVSFGNAYSSNGTVATGTATRYRSEDSPDQALIELQDSTRRIRVPPTIIPPMNVGGKEGWWVLSDVVMAETQITARFSLNWLNSPKVTIDRRTGQIQINGLGRGDFRGACEAIDPSAEARRF